MDIAAPVRLDSFNTRRRLSLAGQEHDLFSLRELEKRHPGLPRLPFSLRVMLENLLRNEDGVKVRADDIEALARWEPGSVSQREIAFTPARVLLQDFTGVPAVVDLAVMRDAVARLGGDPTRVNPLQPVDLVIDHSVQIDHHGTLDSMRQNVELEFERTRSATCSCAGARRRSPTSAWCRRPRASSTR